MSLSGAVRDAAISKSEQARSNLAIVAAVFETLHVNSLNPLCVYAVCTYRYNSLTPFYVTHAGCYVITETKR